jgi:SAM-dependent methyltransferase
MFEWRRTSVQRTPDMTNPSLDEIEQKLSGEDLDAWLQLWAIEQGPAKPASLALMAAVVPGAPDAALRVLDLCCGPGDAGRAIHARFPAAEIDGVDRDPFLAGLCKAVNRRRNVPGRVLVRDLKADDWRDDLAGPYDVIVVANALHWFRLPRVNALLADVMSLLRPGGVFVLMEPVSPEPALAATFGAWQAAQPPQHNRQDWLNFWTRINTLLGYDHIAAQLGAPDDARVGDSLTALGWAALIEAAGFAPIDILLRDPEKLVAAAFKPEAGA